MAISENLVNDLRVYVVDLAETNVLNFNQEELGDSYLSGAISDGVEDYNLILPLSTLVADNLLITDQSWPIIKRFAAANVFKKMRIIHIRNENPVSDSGFQVDEYGKTQYWQILESEMRAEAIEKASNFKMAAQMGSFGTMGFND